MTKDEKSCMFCRFFKIEMGTPAWSENTPGLDWSMECKLNHWSYGTNPLDEEEDDNIDQEDRFREILLTANHCRNYIFFKEPITEEMKIKIYHWEGEASGENPKHFNPKRYRL